MFASLLLAITLEFLESCTILSCKPSYHLVLVLYHTIQMKTIGEYLLECCWFWNFRQTVLKKILGFLTRMLSVVHLRILSLSLSRHRKPTLLYSFFHVGLVVQDIITENCWGSQQRLKTEDGTTSGRTLPDQAGITTGVMRITILWRLLLAMICSVSMFCFLCFILTFLRQVQIFLESRIAASSVASQKSVTFYKIKKNK